MNRPMKRIKLFFTVLTVLMASAVAFAQNVTVTGVVRDASTNEPVPFASIQVKGTLTGGSTETDGKYSLVVPSDAVLVFTSIGYQSLEMPVGGKSVIDVLLHPDTEMLDETIVIAFGTATKESFTGSATVVKSSDIAKVQSSDATRALEGMVAGVQMTTSSGSLGSSPSIRIRGTGSIYAGSAPLYIVDGVPFSGDMNNINPNDIESMTVLKDAASNALYGSRGANGVIMITTKKAKAGDAVVNIDAKWGWNTKALKNYDYITDPAAYYEAHYSALYNYYRYGKGMSDAQSHLTANNVVAGPSTSGGLGYQVFTVPEGQAFIGTNGKVNPGATLGRHITYKGQEYWLQPDNWMDETYRQSLRQEYNISVSGTTGKASIFASFGYLNNKGIIDGSDMYRYSARLRADYQAKSWLKVGANLGYTNYNWNNGNTDEGDGASTGNVFRFAASMAPIYPVYLRDGNGNIMVDSRGYNMYDYGAGSNAGLIRPNSSNSNPLQTLTLNKNNSEGNAINGTGYAEVSFLKDFKVTFNVGFGLDETRSTGMNNPYYGQFASTGGTLSKGHGRTMYINMQQLIEYDKTIKGVHHLSVLLGHESYKTTTYSLSASKSGLFSIDNLELNGAAVDGRASGSAMDSYNNEGYLARIQYDYADKLFLSGSYRLDASSRFHPDHRWGSFWSFGAGWLINKESWFNAPWVDMLKIKASVGSQGNDNIGNYRYLDTYSVGNGAGDVAVIFATKGNPNITWETNTNFNAGVDFDFFAGRLSGSAEYFYRHTSDMLYFFPTPQSIGYGGYYDNVGDMRNSGVEVTLNGTVMRKKNFNWDIYLNFTHYTNKILSIPEQNKTMTKEGYRGFQSGTYFYGEGLPINTFLMQKYAGVDRNTGESLWYQDVLDEKGNVVGRKTTNKYTEATYYLCDDPTPKLYGGFGTNLAFYGFDVSVSFTYSIGGLSMDSGYQSLVSSPQGSSVGGNIHKDVMKKAWTPENPDTDFPRWQYGDQYSASASDRFLTDASYLNLQNAQIGYTFPEKLTRHIHVSRLRLYVSCDNVIYWSRRNGFDPRYSFNGSTSAVVNSPVRTLSGGINITF